jgi:sulfoxide reductase heme-binding subunit YedZ
MPPSQRAYASGERELARAHRSCKCNDRRSQRSTKEARWRSRMSVRRATQSATQPGGTLGTGRDWRRRLTFHHTPIGFTSAVALVLLLGLSPFTNFGHGDTSLGFDPGRLEPGSDAFVSRLTTSSGYVALGLLGLTLLVGPANLLLRRRNPVSTYLRRDLGTWTAIFSVIHVIAGFEVGDGGTFGFLDFFVADGRPLTSSFGLGNWTGLAALVIVVGLLAISTNRSVRELKAERWKNLQRLNYTLFALVVLHSIFYGALSRMTSPFTIILIYTVTAVLVGQAVGIWLWRRRGSRTAPCVTPRRPGEAHESDPRAGRGARGHATRLTLLIALFAAVFAGAVLVARSEEQVADRGDGQPAAARETQPDPRSGRRTTQDGLRLALDRTMFASDASGEPLSFRPTTPSRLQAPRLRLLPVHERVSSVAILGRPRKPLWAFRSTEGSNPSPSASGAKISAGVPEGAEVGTITAPSGFGRSSWGA